MWRQQNTDNHLCGDSRTHLTLCVAAAEHSLPFVWRCPFAQNQRHVSLYLHSVVALFGQVQHADAVQHQAYDTHNSSFTLTPCEQTTMYLVAFFRTSQDHLDRRLAVSTLLQSNVGRTRQSPHYWSLLWEGHGSLHTTGVYCGKDTAVSTLLESTAGRTQQSPHYWSLLWEGHSSLHTTEVYCGKDTAVSTVFGSSAERTRQSPHYLGLLRKGHAERTRQSPQWVDSSTVETSMSIPL